MYKCLVQIVLLLVGAVYLTSCSSANNKPVLVKFSKDSSSIVFSGIDPAGLLVIRNTPGVDTSYASVLSVLQVPSDQDTTSMELPLKGKVTVTDSTVVFTPLTNFVRGERYLVISYINAKFGSQEMLWTGKMNHSVKPLQVTLGR